MEKQSKYLVIYDKQGREISNSKLPNFLSGKAEYQWCRLKFKARSAQDKNADHWDIRAGDP